MDQAKSIADVISKLDDIINWSKLQQHRAGYFAVLYRRMTIAVQQGIINGSFENAERMAQLDVNFANRYFEAWQAYSDKQPCTSAWTKVFDTCNAKSLIILQHLLLGINTHINLDLAIAAAKTSPGKTIFDLQNDFDKINVVIAAVMQTIQGNLVKIWPPLKLVLAISNKEQDAVLNFSITNARKISWANATILANLEEQAFNTYIDSIDGAVVEVAERIINPGLMTALLLKPVLLMESENISDNIDKLNE